MTDVFVRKLTIIGSDNGLLPGQHQAIIRTNTGILLFGPLGTNFCKILIAIYTFSFRKMHVNMLSAKWQPFCLGPNVLKSSRHIGRVISPYNYYLSDLSQSRLTNLSANGSTAFIRKIFCNWFTGLL